MVANRISARPAPGRVLQPAQRRRPRAGRGRTAARRRSRRAAIACTQISGTSAGCRGRQVARPPAPAASSATTASTATSGRSMLPCRRKLPVSTATSATSAKLTAVSGVDRRWCASTGSLRDVAVGDQARRRGAAARRATSRSASRKRCSSPLLPLRQVDRVLGEGQHVQPPGLPVDLLAAAVEQQHPRRAAGADQPAALGQDRGVAVLVARVVHQDAVQRAVRIAGADIDRQVVRDRGEHALLQQEGGDAVADLELILAGRRRSSPARSRC